MKQQKTAGFRRAFSLVMAVLMLATYAISASALEPPLNL